MANMVLVFCLFVFKHITFTIVKIKHIFTFDKAVKNFQGTHIREDISQ